MRRLGPVAAIPIAVLVPTWGRAAGQEPKPASPKGERLTVLPLLARVQRGLLPVEQQRSARDPDPRARELLARVRIRVDAVRRAASAPSPGMLGERARSGTGPRTTYVRGARIARVSVAIETRPQSSFGYRSPAPASTRSNGSANTGIGT